MARSLRAGPGRRRLETYTPFRLRRAALAGALAAGAALLLACAGPGLARRHLAGEQSWRASAPPTPLPGGAALFAGDRLLEREALVRAVLRRNPSIRAARWAWKAALARYPQVTSLDDPMLGYGVSPTSFGSNTVRDAHRVDLAQRLPFPGKLALRGEIALAEAEAAEHDAEAVRQRLATMASLLYDELYFLDRALEINAEHLALLEEFRRIATVRYEVGEASQQDPLQAELEEARLAQRQVVLETGRRVAREQLNALLHRSPEEPLPPPPARLALPAGREFDREALASEALRARPELRSLDARIEGRDSAVDLARREFFPDVTLVGAYNGVMQPTDVRPFVGIQINVPLRIDRRRAALDEAQADLARAQSERERLADEVRLGVASGIDRLEEARRVLSLFESRLLPASRDRVEAARAGFETGRNSFLALIEAERDLRNTRLGYQEALAAVSSRWAELERALGRTPGLGEGATP